MKTYVCAQCGNTLTPNSTWLNYVEFEHCPNCVDIDIEYYEETIEELETEYDKLDIKYMDLESDNYDLKDKIESLKDEIAELNETITSLEMENAA